MNYAVLIGINTYKQVSGLDGCLNDIEDVAKQLSSSASVADANIAKLLDAAATKVAIMATIKDVVGKLKFGERAYIHFSGHGVQLPSDDVEEPDGLDEVLCAYDFDWTPDTAVGDDELHSLLVSRAPGSEVLVTLDCCHSGDQLRALSGGLVAIRTLTPPPSIRAEILRRRGSTRGLRSLAREPGIAFMSACSPWEVAADTSFDGRPNGAFTYYFLREERAAAPVTFEEVAGKLKPDLTSYNMTPVAEGEVGLAWVAPNRRALRKRRSANDGPRATTLVRGSHVLFERSFDANFAGQRVALQIRITADNGQILLFPSIALFGSTLAIPPVVVSGDQHFEVPLGVLGARLAIGVNGWAMSSGTLRFTLDLTLVTSMWFVPPVHIGQVPISIPVAQLTRATLPAVASPADLAALLVLQGQPVGGRDPGPTIQGHRDPRLQVFASGIAGWGPNWREDRLIRPFASTPRPEGIQRAAVEIGPQRGSGNVYVVGWASAQETDFDFILHMGNNFFGGWGDIDWRVVGFYYNESPFPRSLPAPAKAARATNGHARATGDDFALPTPESGGSASA